MQAHFAERPVPTRCAQLQLVF